MHPGTETETRCAIMLLEAAASHAERPTQSKALQSAARTLDLYVDAHHGDLSGIEILSGVCTLLEGIDEGEPAHGLAGAVLGICRLGIERLSAAAATITTAKHPTSGEYYAVREVAGVIVAAAGPLHYDPEHEWSTEELEGYLMNRSGYDLEKDAAWLQRELESAA